ncbi:MAG: sensor histidine kinase N-terminal domain-containing protein [Proteobacteria bacterium]|nr:sensor histidine kinase N-terminal domain-containing protein [Pseudomonadota bacterium]
MKAPSIRKRLFGLLLVPAVLILIAGTLSDYFTALTPYRDAYDQALFDAALAISAHVRADYQGEPRLSLPPDAIAVLRYDSYDSIFFKVTTESGAFIAGDRDLPQLPRESSNPARGYARYHGESVRLVTYRTKGPTGLLNVCVAETLHKREHTRARILLSSLAVDISQLSLVLILIWIGVRRALGPLRSVEAQISRRSARDLTPLPRESIPTEIQGLVAELNRLFVTVRATSDAQRRFLESAAHQLRTPLTGLQVQLELLTEDQAAAPVRERLAPLLEATQRLTHTTQQLLALARSDEAANLRWEFAQIDLPDLVESTVADRISAALSAGIDIGADTERGTIQGVRWLLLEALSNLVNNSIAHTPAGGTVTVRCGVATGAAFLEVSDSGIGIPVDERERVLGRFFRGSNARGTGSGLGLAIVAEVAQLHGATVSVDSGPDGKGTTVRIVFQPAGPQLNR